MFYADLMHFSYLNIFTATIQTNMATGRGSITAYTADGTACLSLLELQRGTLVY